MSAHVGERLLDDPVDRALELGVQTPVALLGHSAGRNACLGAQVDLDLHVQPVDRLGAPCKRLQCGFEPEIVERGGPELGDQVTETVDVELISEPV